MTVSRRIGAWHPSSQLEEVPIVSITEAQRYEIYESMKSQHGEQVANDLMSLLPPVGWADVATKHDLDVMLGSTSAEFGSVRAEIGSVRREMESEFASVRAEIGSVRREMESGFAVLRSDIDRLDRTQHLIIGWLIVSQATLFTAICAATALILRAI